MKFQLIGCSHQNVSLEWRERLAFTVEQLPSALEQFKSRFPQSEAVVLSTCNRVEVYLAADRDDVCPTPRDVVEFVAEFHRLDPLELFERLYERTDEDAVRHLFAVASGLDSMVLGEAQISAQVRQAYELACAGKCAGTWMHLLFQRAIRVARRVASETLIQQHRLSIPSVAVGDFAREIFERFDDKLVVVVGAGQMAEETLKYLKEEGARKICLVNRRYEKAEQLAERLQAQACPWDQWWELLVDADIVVTAVGASQPILDATSFAPMEKRRNQRPLFLLDLGVPRNVDPAVGKFPGVYLCSIDDLKEACEKNRRAREKELPRAQRIIEEEVQRFMAELQHRATAPTIRRLKLRAEQIKQEELQRLLNRLGALDPQARREIEITLDRLVNKLLHPPLESLRTHAERGSLHQLLDALVHLFKLRE